MHIEMLLSACVTSILVSVLYLKQEKTTERGTKCLSAGQTEMSDALRNWK